MFTQSKPNIEIKIVNLNDLSDKQRRDWNLMVNSSQEATIYHTIEWNDLQQRYTNILNRTAFAYWDNKPVGLFTLFRRRKSLLITHACNAPLETPYGGPVTVSEIPEDIKIEIIHNLVKSLTTTKDVMTTSFNTILDFDISILQKLNLDFDIKSSSVLDLGEGEAAVYKGMRRDHKRRLKKAESSGFKPIIDDNFQYIDEYYELLKSTYSRLGNEKLVDKEFYRLCCSQLPDGWIRLFMVKNRDDFIAGGLVLVHKKSVIFWRGVALDEFMRLGSSRLLYWTIIQWAIKKGYQTMDVLHNPTDSLYHFKQGFGCVLQSSYSVTKKSRKWNYLQRFRKIFSK